MADPEGESLESWLNKATNPSNRQEEWEYIIGFCDQINKELEGPQISVRLLVHKIQSPQEWESLQALTVLEACMKNCGRRFHNEVGKFRFLNELIKVVSPKYLGDRVSEQVKTKVIELLYSWSVALPDEAKITEAYQMLKMQGIVTEDPEVPVDKTLVPSPKPNNPVFDNEEKSKRLAELLKSKKPEDLQEANRIIKSMVKEDEAIQQKASHRASTLEEVNNSVKLLNEMLSHFKRDESTQADKELLTDLYNDCDKLRTAVFRLATETEDDDSALGDILHASDDLSRVINSYKKIVEGQTIVIDIPGSTASKHPNDGSSSEILIDLADLDLGSPSPLKHVLTPPQHSESLPTDLLTLAARPSSSNTSSGSSSFQISPPSTQLPSSLSLLDEELGSLGLGSLDSKSNKSAEKNTKEAQSNQWISSQTSKPVIDLLFSSAPINPLISTAPPTSEATSVTSFENSLQQSSKDFAMLDVDKANSQSKYSSSGGRELRAWEENIHPALTTFSFPAGITPVPSAVSSAKPQSFTPDSPLFKSLSPTLPTSHSPSGSDISLNTVFVPLEAIQPSKEGPVTAYDKDGVRVLLHFATDHPPGRPDVLVIVVSMLNTAPLLVRNVVLQAAVPKSMRVKLQPPSGTEMVPFTPFMPPSSITQIMLLANPLKEKVRMRYKLTFILGDRQVTESGEIDKFPPVERWGHL
ncbi:ADP-ribosylation factor-binding protein GGA3a isoform X2 [Rhinichthys klamathensis goyatoka]|uniref:ADP-ribosylation factor-binding protein GGA3a isoform X2 n=1 Tax=Rhinichthys klamathensis goyatoka TaxID=3034132 RepID=UPI0024B5FFA4|nr:ADP-ribosylation factor-binding protein GGA3a isoform X2 [Rhinichthys klamathensis goyatoka]